MKRVPDISLLSSAKITWSKPTGSDLLISKLGLKCSGNDN